MQVDKRRKFLFWYEDHQQWLLPTEINSVLGFLFSKPWQIALQQFALPPREQIESRRRGFFSSLESLLQKNDLEIEPLDFYSLVFARTWRVITQVTYRVVRMVFGNPTKFGNNDDAAEVLIGSLAKAALVWWSSHLIAQLIWARENYPNRYSWGNSSSWVDVDYNKGKATVDF